MTIAIRFATVFATAMALTPGRAQVPTRPTDTARVSGADSVALKSDSGATTLDTAALKTLVRQINTARQEESRVIWLADEYPVLRARLRELQRSGPPFPLLRSTSTLLWPDTTGRDGMVPLFPQLQLIRNTAIPFSQNHGGLWAGRGWNSRITGGAALKFGRVRVVLAPEIVTSQNDSFPPRGDSIVPSPAIPAGRSAFSYPWYANGPYSVDLPLRFGTKAIRRLRPGQSSILADAGPVTVGFSTENEWWGPGVDNALVLSNNAPGFPHLLIRNAQPLETRVGSLEFRWLVGGLTNSTFFDTASSRTTRSIAAGAIALRPRGTDNFSVGIARSVIGTSTGWGENLSRWLDVFRNTGHPNLGAPYDSTLRPGGYEQLVSAFARWALPASGAEIYGEWGRLDFPRGLRDLLTQPNRGQAYTLGLQWTRPVGPPGSQFHLRLENTSLEQSLALRNRFAGVWYTSRRVLQGFTNEGEVLGAAVGPGSSGQTLELNYRHPRAFFGVEIGRARYNEDVHQAMPMLDYLRWCSHDVNLQWGWRAGFTSRFGSASIRSLYQNRENAYFQSAHGCPSTTSVGQTDIRNNNLTLTFSPGLRW